MRDEKQEKQKRELAGRGARCVQVGGWDRLRHTRAREAGSQYALFESRKLHFGNLWKVLEVETDDKGLSEGGGHPAPRPDS